MRRRLNPLRRPDPSTPAPASSAADPTPDAPVAWAPDEPSPDATAEPGNPADPSVAPPADLGEPEPETTVFPAVGGPPAPPSDGSEEPETAVFTPVPPTAQPEPAPVTLGDAPQDAVASPPLEVLSVQPDGTVLPAPDPSAPAGIEPGAIPDEPGFRVRGRLRRRLRYLRRVRELGLRDLGGLVFDLHRFEREGGPLVAGKLAALTTVDQEVRELETALDDRRELIVLREPGLAACPRCAALHGTDANFCPNCGMPFSGGIPAAVLGPPPAGSFPPPPGHASSVTAAHPRVPEQGPTPGPV